MVGSMFGRLLSSNGLKSLTIQQRLFGQLVNETHPHILEKGQVTPGITKAEYFRRRCDLMKNILQGNPNRLVVALVPSAGKLYMAPDVPYPFRQNSDFLYLCGFQEPDSVLVLTNIGCKNDFRSLLFVPKRDKLRELWDGPRTGSEKAISLTGCDEAYNVDDLEKELSSMLKNVKSIDLWYDEESSFHCSSHKKYMNCFHVEQKVKKVMPIKSHIQNLRIVKSEAEIALMKHTCRIGSKSLEEVMKFSKSGVDESHLQAKMDFECRMLGAQGMAYPPVVAGGERANIIHYINNNRIVQDGEMVLMDAGSDYYGYCSDITRTWPVNGRFSPAQKELYEALLEVQATCISLCQPDYLTLNQIYVLMLNLLGKQLKRLNLINKDIDNGELQRAAMSFCPHHVGHYLGMDVHDVDQMSRSIKLRPGTVITIEPGVYVPKDYTDAPKHFRGLGIRIEDNILVTKDHPTNLTEMCPKLVEEIEKAMDASH